MTMAVDTSWCLSQGPHPSPTASATPTGAPVGAEVLPTPTPRCPWLRVAGCSFQGAFPSDPTYAGNALSSETPGLLVASSLHLLRVVWSSAPSPRALQRPPRIISRPEGATASRTSPLPAHLPPAPNRQEYQPRTGRRNKQDAQAWPAEARAQRPRASPQPSAGLSSTVAAHPASQRPPPGPQLTAQGTRLQGSRSTPNTQGGGAAGTTAQGPPTFRAPVPKRLG